MTTYQEHKPEVTNELAEKLLRKVINKYKTENHESIDKLSKTPFYFFGGDPSLTLWGDEFFYEDKGVIYNVLRECSDILVKRELMSSPNDNSYKYFLTSHGLTYFTPYQKALRVTTKYQPFLPWLSLAISVIALVVSISVAIFKR
jgi:hypothetical protein